MSDQTGKKRAGFGITAALAMAVLSACVLPASQAIGSEADADATTTPAPAAATPAEGHAAPAAAGGIDAARIAAGRDLFTNWGCTACHTLADANASGAVGPSLDGDTSLSEDFITARVTNGQGAMPGFGGQLTPKEISDLAYYLTKVAKK